MIEFAALEHFHFLRPLWLLLLLPCGVLTLVLLRRGDSARAWKGFVAEHLLQKLIVPGRGRALFTPFTAFLLLYPLLALSLAGPSWQRAPSPLAEDQSALVIAVDLSSSMGGRDLQPSRLQRAREKILRLARERGDAYTALIAYAGTAHTVLPLTNDQEVLLHYLDALEVGMLPRRGKAPESVLALTRDLIDARRHASLLLVCDGASNASAQAFASVDEDQDLQLLVWGMGKTQGEIERDRSRGLVSDAQPLQETQLRAIAASAGGHYQRVTADDSDVKRIGQRIALHFELGDDDSRPWRDGGYALLPPIMLLFLLWFRSGWVLRW